MFAIVLVEWPTDPSRHFIAYASAKAALVRTTETVADEMKTFGWMGSTERMSASSPTDGAGRGSVYYRHAGRIPLASRISLEARRRMFDRFMSEMRPTAETRILDVGVTSDTQHPESNFFEQLYPHRDRITAVGTEDGSHLVASYPGLRYQQVTPAAPLPFPDAAFDVVFSNAVIEHVGSRTSQQAFVNELRRVGRAFFVTTPNRWFPIEHHTGVPLLHYLPPRAYRGILNRTRLRYWADEAHLHILTARSFRRLFPPSAAVRIVGVRTLGVTSNLIAVGRGGR